MVWIRRGEEFDLKAAVAIAGPVIVGVDHSHSAFQVDDLAIVIQSIAHNYLCICVVDNINCIYTASVTIYLIGVTFRAHQYNLY